MLKSIKYLTGFILTVLILSCDNKKSEEIIVDQRDQTESVIEIMKIDSVWAGHPVRFSLYSHDESQYIAYYNSNRKNGGGAKKVNR